MVELWVAFDVGRWPLPVVVVCGMVLVECVGWMLVVGACVLADDVVGVA